MSDFDTPAPQAQTLLQVKLDRQIEACVLAARQQSLGLQEALQLTRAARVREMNTYGRQPAQFQEQLLAAGDDPPRAGGRCRPDWLAIEAQNDGGPRVHLRWRESGGPQVPPPQRRGFGLKFINFAATQDLGGHADLSYAPEGLNAEVTFPL